MSDKKLGYNSLLKDEGFSHLNFRKIRHLLGAGIGEMIGVATFMALGCGNMVTSITGSDNTILTTVLSFAFGIATSIIMVNHISGSILNPSLNLAAMWLGHFSIYRMIFYTIFQMAGAAIGVAMVKSVTPNLGKGFCVPQPNPEVGVKGAILVELFNSTLLTWVFCSVVDPRNAANTGTIFVKFGVVIMAIAIPSAKYSGCSMNPARAFGPALVMWFWDYHWIYWVCPCVAASLTALLYRILFDPKLSEPQEQEREDQSPTA